jgi:hypothetical protein
VHLGDSRLPDPEALFGLSGTLEDAMAIQMIMRYDGMSLEDYDRARNAVHWENDVPKGAIYHVCSHDGSALRITDVWETAEDFQAFVENRLMPELARLGYTQQPEVEVYPVHAIFAPAYSVQVPTQAPTPKSAVHI